MTAAAPGFLYVEEHVARNPVARAIARHRVADAVRDFQTRLYLLSDGENVQTDVMAAAKVIAVALAVRQHAGQLGAADARVMQGSMGQLATIAERGFVWRTTDAVAIDVGLQRAVEVYRAASAQQIQAAHKHVGRIEATA